MQCLLADRDENVETRVIGFLSMLKFLRKIIVLLEYGNASSCYIKLLNFPAKNLGSCCTWYVKFM